MKEYTLVKVLVFATVVAALPAFAARTISTSYTLTADEDWRSDGVVTVVEGVSVDLNGHVLYLAGLAGKGSFITSTADAAFKDLTQHENLDNIVTTYTNGTQVTDTGDSDGRNAFKRNTSWASPNRINVSASSLPYTIVYDFTTATCINCYKIRCGTTTVARAPKEWTLQGSNDNDTWTTLDEQTNQGSWTATEDREFRIENTAAYRYYKISFTAANANTYLALHYIQYGYVGNQIRIDPEQSAGFAAAENSISDSIDCIVMGGKLAADIDLRGINRKVTLAGDLDLNGCALKAYALDGSSTVTSSAEVPDGTTALTTTDTSNLSQYVTVYANGSTTTGHSSYPAVNAFDNTATTANSAYLNSTTYPVDFVYDFTTPTAVNRYTVEVSTDSVQKKRAPKTWKLYGSNDSATDATKWMELDNRDMEKNSSGEVQYAPKADLTFDNATPYRYYILRITAAGNGAANLQVNEIEYYYKGDGNYVSVEVGGLSESDLTDISASANVEIVSSGDLTLTAATDWTKLGALELTGTIDLAGHDLTVASLVGSGTITDSSSAATGTLHAVISSGDVTNSTVSLTGNLRLSKEGSGTLTAAKTSQTYAGGTEIVAGQITCNEDGGNSPFGTGGILVDAGGTLEMNGKAGYSGTLITLNGGTLQNSTSVTTGGDGNIGKVLLIADSTFNCANNTFFGVKNDASLSSYIDLGGHTLTVSLGNNTLRLYNTTITNGTFDVTSGGAIISGGDGVEARTADFKMKCKLNIAGPMQVRNYESLWEGDNAGDSKLSVYGTFTPTTTHFYGCTLMDGSSIDLSALTDTLSVTSAATGGKTVLSFEDNATVYVNVGTRSLDSSSCLLSWTEETKPSNLSGLNFVRPDDERIYRISVQSDGLYYAGAGLTIIFR